jgi:hypothetical protein
MPVIERALETAALMLGSDKSPGYCLEMICVTTSTERYQVLFAIVAQVKRPCWRAYSNLHLGHRRQDNSFSLHFLAESFHLLPKSATFSIVQSVPTN